MTTTSELITRRVTTACISAFIVVALWGCSTTEPSQTFPEVTFGHLPQIQVNAARVEVRVQYKSPLKSPNVEHLSPLSFEQALNTWASHRFITDISSENYVVVRINEDSITEKELPMDTGLTGALKKEQEYEYESVLEVEFKLLTPSGTSLADANTRVWQRRSVTEGLSQYERRMIWLEMVEKAVNEFDRQLQSRLNQNFKNYMRF